VQLLTREELARPTNYQRYFAECERREQQERDEIVRRHEIEVEEYRRTHVLPLLRGTSQAAQRIRNQIQKTVGSGSHLGACETF